MSSMEQSTPNIEAVYRSALERHGVFHGNVRPTGNTLPTSTRYSEVTGSSARMDRVNPDYGLLRYEIERLSTFHDWTSSGIVQPKALARSGLFYTGQTDRTRCAFCRGVLHYWQPGDQPDIEHRRYFPDCPFLRQYDVGNVPIDHQTMAACISGDDVNAAAATSFAPADDVTGKRKLTSGGGDRFTERHTTTTTTTLGNEELLKENRRLKEAKTCKVCMDNEVNVIFLPCGHLVSCEHCASKLRNCPICRTYIRGTVRAFLS